MSAALRLLPSAGYVTMPWKNGAGTTQEIARAPAAGSDFDWRLSLATVAASGPFSVYAGYQRAVALASGRGFTLTVGSAAPVRLAAPGEHLVFPGAAATRCDLTAEPCTDLSLMVREPGAVLGLERITLAAAPVTLSLAAPLAALVCLAGRVRCRAPAGLAAGECLLAAFDTLLAEDAAALEACALGPEALVVLARWRLGGEASARA